jgi:hypothetical protein
MDDVRWVNVVKARLRNVRNRVQHLEFEGTAGLRRGFDGWDLRN